MDDGGSTAHPRAQRRVRIEGRRLRFAAAHMAVFDDALEPLHGHNYAVTIEVEGELSAIGWIVDFGTLKQIGRAICDRLDHRFLLQEQSTQLTVLHSSHEWQIQFGVRHYTFPDADVLPLPISNTTAELIAAWFWVEVVAGLRAEKVQTIHRLTIGIEEAPGQSGWFEADLPGV